MRRRGGILEVERDAHTVDADGVASRVSFLVRVDATAGGSAVPFRDARGAPVPTPRAPVALARRPCRGARG